MSEYFKTDALSYSTLRNLSIGPAYHKFIQEQDSDEKEHFIIGGAVDILLTEPEEFWKLYALEFQEVCENIPTGQMKVFVDTLFKLDREHTDYVNISDVNWEESYKIAGFKQKSIDTVEKEYKEKWDNYYAFLCKKHDYNKVIENKQILTNNQYKLVCDIVNSLKNNRFTSKYFNTFFDGSQEVFNQLEIYWEASGQKCKSKLDKVIVNHEKKTIQPIDIKTTGKSTFSFNSSALSYRYDIQASFYLTALYWLINKSGDKYWSNLTNYTILPFIFIVESTKSPGLPLVYECSDKFLSQGMDGFYLNGKYYKGWKELINEYIWYKENNSWTYDKQIIENEGVIKLEYC